MRVLVLDPTHILTCLVRRMMPVTVDVEETSSFDDAQRRVRDSPPSAVVVSLPLAHLSWRSFQHLCASRRPPVPVLYESSRQACATEVDIDPTDGYAAFLPKAAHPAALRAALAALVDAVERAG